MQRGNIREVLQRHTDELMDVPGVAGVAEGESQGEPCITVFVLNKTTAIQRQIPSAIEGYPVHIEVSGEFLVFGN